MRKINSIKKAKNRRLFAIISIPIIIWAIIGYPIGFILLSSNSGIVTNMDTVYPLNTSDRNFFRITVNESRKYVIMVDNYGMWYPTAENPAIILYDNAWKINGIKIDVRNDAYEFYEFYSTHSGYYYVQITHASEGYYQLEYCWSDLTTPPVGLNYINIWRLLFLLTPILICVAGISLLIQLILKTPFSWNRGTLKERIECPNCKSLNSFHDGYCIDCCYTSPN